MAVHIYTQTIHRTIQNNNTYNTPILEECGPCPVLASITLAFALQPKKKHGGNFGTFMPPNCEWIWKEKEWNRFIKVPGKQLWKQIWCDFDRASSLICGNKMPTRCNRFLLQILLLAQHVSGTTMLIIRSSGVLYKWLLPVVFGALVFKLSVWCGAECYVCGLRAVALPRQ